jgi:ABC-2 type transport system ATP-binding protein
VTVGRSAASAIVADGLTRSFNGQLALVDLTLEASPGEVLAVLGPNGAGKTTTVRLLNGVLAPDRGSSRVLGIDPALDGNEVRRRTGVLTENAGLDDRLTAWENLVVTGRIRGMNKTDAGTRATAMLARFGMADRADDRVQGFSTGQRKRVALGRAAPRSRHPVPRRADVGPRSRCHARRHRPHRHPRGRARPHGRALHALPR